MLTKIAATNGAFSLAVVSILFIWAVVVVIGQWKVFTKAGRAGILSIIPIVNIVVICRIAKRPGWWVILLIIPIVNIFIAFVLMTHLARAFGKGIGYALGLLFLSPIFMVMLGFGDAVYNPDAV